MKNTHRHQLKGNELADILGSMLEYVRTHSGHIVRWGGGLVAVALLVVAGLAYRQSANAGGGALLGEALVALGARVVPPAATDAAAGALPAAASVDATGSFSSEGEKLRAALPKLQAAADAYPDNAAGITARYHLAGALAALGRLPEAQQAFEEVARRAGSDSLYGRMARLGLADVQTKAGKVDEAITTLKSLAAGPDSDLPADAVLMELARAYVAKGDLEQARKTFTQIVDQHPASPYLADAQAQVDTLKGS